MRGGENIDNGWEVTCGTTRGDRCWNLIRKKEGEPVTGTMMGGWNQIGESIETDGD